MIAVKADGIKAHIDLWLMSCRVLGRKVEEAILLDVMERARAKGLRTLVGEYRPTAKNGIVSELYPRLGFKEVSRSPDAVSYELSLDTEVANLDFIRKVDKTVEAVCLTDAFGLQASVSGSGRSERSHCRGVFRNLDVWSQIWSSDR